MPRSVQRAHYATKGTLCGALLTYIVPRVCVVVSYLWPCVHAHYFRIPCRSSPLRCIYYTVLAVLIPLSTHTHRMCVTHTDSCAHSHTHAPYVWRLHHMSYLDLYLPDMPYLRTLISYSSHKVSIGAILNAHGSTMSAHSAHIGVGGPLPYVTHIVASSQQ
jgi:hypothetical protein